MLIRDIALLAFFSCVEVAAEEASTQSKPITHVESPTAAITREYINVLEKLGNRFEDVIKGDQDAAQSEAKAIDAHLQTFVWIVGVVGTILSQGRRCLDFLARDGSSIGSSAKRSSRCNPVLVLQVGSQFVDLIRQSPNVQ